MNKELLNLYLQYARTEEARAVLFVKKHLSQAKGYWVDILDSRRCWIPYNHLHDKDDRLSFEFVTCSLYERRIHPEYPPKSDYMLYGILDQRDYYLMVRAITWETAHRDIENQKSQNIVPKKFKISGEYFNKNANNTGFFREDAPDEIKALADNLNDRTNPLWDIALNYCNNPEYVYKIRSIKRIK